MICYFDASFLLSAVLEERPASEFAPWDLAGERLSSDLLRFECWVAIKRAAALQPSGTPDTWIAERMGRLERFFERINFKSIDESIEEVVRREPRLAGCRTLDAIHVATALYFSPHLDEPLVVCTFDARMRKAAELTRFPLHPPAGESAAAAPEDTDAHRQPGSR